MPEDEYLSTNGVSPADIMARAGLTNDNHIKMQQEFKLLARDQRSKMKSVMTLNVFGTAHAFDPSEVIFELEMKNDTPCYELLGM